MTQVVQVKDNITAEDSKKPESKNGLDDEWEIIPTEQEEKLRPSFVTLADIQEKLDPNTIPYQKAINRLDLLNARALAKTPIQKLNVFGEVTNIIKQEISDFWNGVNVNQDKLSLDGDQILMLHVYIAARSGLQNMFAHLQFCQEFSTPYIKTTRVGYCLTTLEVALKLLVGQRELID